MMRSLWSAVSGLNTHQMEMDVIGNNISNVNTTAYKSQATGFQDVLYQTIKNGSGAGQNTATTSAAQVGLGSKVGSIYTNISAQGSAITTNNVLDLMITGDSFFVISPNAQTGELNFSRDGSFTIDAEGFLVTQNNGYYVMGVMGDAQIGNAVTNLQVINRRTIDWNENGVIDNNETIDYMEGQATTQSYFKGNLNSMDPKLQDGAEGLVQRVEVYGNDGKTYTLKFVVSHLEEDDSNIFNLSLAGITDEDGKSVSFNAIEDIKLEYDKHSGVLTSAGQNNAGQGLQTFTFGGDASQIGPLTVNFNNTTNYASTMGGNSSTLYAYKGDVQGLNKGYPKGTLTGISFSNDGSIYGTYSNGETVRKGQIAVAEFNNAMGLEKVGDNLYAQSLNSGAAQIIDISTTGGYMTSGVLEGSNVDLAKEFTDMITTQRGFQANSRVITTSDELLQVLKGLKR